MERPRLGGERPPNPAMEQTAAGSAAPPQVFAATEQRSPHVLMRYGGSKGYFANVPFSERKHYENRQGINMAPSLEEQRQMADTLDQQVERGVTIGHVHRKQNGVTFLKLDRTIVRDRADPQRDKDKPRVDLLPMLHARGQDSGSDRAAADDLLVTTVGRAEDEPARWRPISVQQ